MVGICEGDTMNVSEIFSFIYCIFKVLFSFFFRLLNFYVNFLSRFFNDKPILLAADNLQLSEDKKEKVS